MKFRKDLKMLGQKCCLAQCIVASTRTGNGLQSLGEMLSNPQKGFVIQDARDWQIKVNI